MVHFAPNRGFIPCCLPACYARNSNSPAGRSTLLSRAWEDLSRSLPQAPNSRHPFNDGQSPLPSDGDQPPGGLLCDFPGARPTMLAELPDTPITPSELPHNAATTATLPRRPLSQVPGAPGPQPGPRGPRPAVPELRGRGLPGCPRASAPQRGTRETPPAAPPAGVSRNRGWAGLFLSPQPLAAGPTPCCGTSCPLLSSPSLRNADGLRIPCWPRRHPAQQPPTHHRYRGPPCHHAPRTNRRRRADPSGQTPTALHLPPATPPIQGRIQLFPLPEMADAGSSRPRTGRKGTWQ